MYSEHRLYDYDKLIAESTGLYKDWWILPQKRRALTQHRQPVNTATAWRYSNNGLRTHYQSTKEVLGSVVLLSFLLVKAGFGSIVGVGESREKLLLMPAAKTPAIGLESRE